MRRAILKSKYKTLVQDALSAALIVGPPLHLSDIPVERIDWLLEVSKTKRWACYCADALLSLHADDPDFKILADLLVKRLDDDSQLIPDFYCGVLPRSSEGDRVLNAMIKAVSHPKSDAAKEILWQLEGAPSELLRRHFDAFKKIMRQETDTSRQTALCWIFAKAGKCDAEVADWARRLALGTQYRTRLLCLANVSPSAKERDAMFAQLLESRFDDYLPSSTTIRKIYQIRGREDVVVPFLEKIIRDSLNPPYDPGFWCDREDAIYGLRHQRSASANFATFKKILEWLDEDPPIGKPSDIAEAVLYCVEKQTPDRLLELAPLIRRLPFKCLIGGNTSVARALVELRRWDGDNK